MTTSSKPIAFEPEIVMLNSATGNNLRIRMAFTHWIDWKQWEDRRSWDSRSGFIYKSFHYLTRKMGWSVCFSFGSSVDDPLCLPFPPALKKTTKTESPMINTHWTTLLLANSAHCYSLDFLCEFFTQLIDWRNRCDVITETLIIDQDNG